MCLCAFLVICRFAFPVDFLLYITESITKAIGRHCPSMLLLLCVCVRVSCVMWVRVSCGCEVVCKECILQQRHNGNRAEVGKDKLDLALALRNAEGLAAK